MRKLYAILILFLVIAVLLTNLSVVEVSPSQIISTPINSVIETPSNEIFNLSFRMTFDEEEEGFFSITFYWDNNESDPNCIYWNFTFVSFTAQFINGENFSSPLNVSIRKAVPSGFSGNYYRYTVSISELYGETKNGEFWVNVTMLAAGIKNGAYIPHAVGSQNITIVNVRCYENSLTESGSGECLVNVTPQINFHDVAVVELFPYSTEVPYGEDIKINVTVGNYGTLTETFNFAILLNNTVILTYKITLPSNTITTLHIEYSTTNLEVSAYILWAKASIVLGETEIENNMLIDGIISVLKSESPAIGGPGGRMKLLR